MAKKKANKKIWSEIRNTYTDASTGLTHIDAWLTEEENDEDGRTIATVDVDGNVVYNDERAKTDENAQEYIQEVINDNRDDKEKLVDEVIEKLKEDFAGGDYTVLDELLHFVKSTNLVQALDEEEWEKYTFIPNPNKV